MAESISIAECLCGHLDALFDPLTDYEGPDEEGGAMPFELGGPVLTASLPGSVLAAEHLYGSLDVLLDGPLTEYEGYDGGGDELPEPGSGGEDASSELPADGEGPESSRDAAKQGRAARERERKRKRRRWNRKCAQEEAGTSEKDHVKRHRMQSAGSSIPTDFNAVASPNVTAPA